MTIVGIIAEYNPFHNGHAYQIEQIKSKIKDAKIIAVMSGSFTQRGEPAILDKFTRAKLAIYGGCDLVLELPFVFAVRSAQDFAYGGVNLLNNLNTVDYLTFGSEIDDINLIKDVSELINKDTFRIILHNKLKNGISYANALCQSLSQITDIDENLLKQPNVILAVEYLRALRSTKILPLLTKRTFVKHNDSILHLGITSASSIRKALYSDAIDWKTISSTVNQFTLDTLMSTELPFIDRLYLPLITKIICSSPTELKTIYGMNEGLENKIINSVNTTQNLTELINSIVSRRYTRSTIQRLLLHLLIGLSKEQVHSFNKIEYARVLAFNQNGREILKSIKKMSSIPIITKITQHINYKSLCNWQKLNLYQKMLAFDIISTDLHSILYSNINLRKDFLLSPFYIES